MSTSFLLSWSASHSSFLEGVSHTTSIWLCCEGYRIVLSLEFNHNFSLCGLKFFLDLALPWGLQDRSVPRVNHNFVAISMMKFFLDRALPWGDKWLKVATLRPWITPIFTTMLIVRWIQQYILYTEYDCIIRHSWEAMGWNDCTSFTLLTLPRSHPRAYIAALQSER